MIVKMMARKTIMKIEFKKKYRTLHFGPSIGLIVTFYFILLFHYFKASNKAFATKAEESNLGFELILDPVSLTGIKLF